MPRYSFIYDKRMISKTNYSYVIVCNQAAGDANRYVVDYTLA